MDIKQEILEFEVLGLKLKLRRDDASKVDPQSVVELVRERSNEIIDKMPSLKREEIAILLCLELAKEKLELEEEYRDNVNHLHTVAGDALQFIEEVSPTTL
tara:strand:+ start:90370 stop:90672 length:303 start_codon:yes stop_codon:yes gene_type:complete